MFRITPYQRAAILLAFVLAALMIPQPRPALATDCDSVMPTVFTACQLDVAQYGVYESAASSLWLVNRVLLGGAYWMDALRYQFVEVVFAGAYAALASAIGPLLGPMAVVALVIGALALIALPLTGSGGPINIRNVLTWCVIGPIVLTMGGPYLAQFEQIRTDMGTLLFSSVSGGSLSLGGGAANDMAAPAVLYPSGECGADGAGQPTLRRYSQADLPNVDEQVAALAWATAKDIHCPERPLPMNMYNDGRDGPGYARYGGIVNLDTAARQSALASIKQCINRLLLMILPAFIAMVIALLNLVFACCTMMLWFSLPLGVLFSFFQTNANWFTGLVQRAAGILKTSWLVSILLGIFSSVLLAAGNAGDGLRYSIMAIVAGVFVIRFAFTAFGLFTEAMATMTAVTGLGGNGPSLGKLAGGAVGGAASFALGAATGGVGTALTIAAAARQSGSGRYALAAGAGRIKPLMQLGEVAAGMGLLGDEVADGLFAGHRSTQSMRSGRMAMQGDAKRLDTAGRAEDRRLDRAMRRAENGNIAQRTVRDAQQLYRAGRTGAAAIGRGLGEAGSLRGGAQGISRAVGAMRGAIANPGPALGQAGARALQHSKRAGGQALAATTRRLLPRDQKPLAMSLGAKGRLRFGPGVAPGQLPAGARTERLEPARMRALLRSGYYVQRNAGGTASYWKPQGAPEDGVAKAEPAAPPEQSQLPTREPPVAEHAHPRRQVPHQPPARGRRRTISAPPLAAPARRSRKPRTGRTR